MFPLHYFFLVDLETAADTPVIDYIDDDPSFLREQPGRTPLDQPDIAYFFSLLLALEECSMLLLSVNPILLHSLPSLLQLLPLPAILLLSI